MLLATVPEVAWLQGMGVEYSRGAVGRELWAGYRVWYLFCVSYRSAAGI